MDLTNMFDTRYKGIKVDLSQDLKDRVIEHRNRFFRLFILRYREFLSALITYKNGRVTSINFPKLEVALRNQYQMVIGQNAFGKIVVLGYTTSIDSMDDPAILFTRRRLTKADIDFVVPPSEIPEKMLEIVHDDDCQTGNFVVIRNKVLNYTNDMEILEHYASELAEIVLSRFSISMQAKINTILIGNPNDQGITQLVTDLYNGSPYIRSSKLFDPEENIYRFDNQHMAQNFTELKREYQNKISELNNMLGINSLAVEKESGVSETEAKSNRGFTTSNSNIYLEARNEPLSKLNKRFGLQIEAIYNDEVSSELSNEFLEKEGEKS